MVVRLAECESRFAKTSVFDKVCLFNAEVAPKPMQRKIASCVDKSFEVHGDRESKNKALEADALWAKKMHLDYHPSITINDFTYRGDIDFADIREAICAAYQERP